MNYSYAYEAQKILFSPRLAGRPPRCYLPVTLQSRNRDPHQSAIFRRRWLVESS